MKTSQGKAQPAGFRPDDDPSGRDELGRRLLQTCAAIGVPTCLIVGTIRLTHGGAGFDRSVAANFAYAALCIGILLLTRRGNWRPAAHLMMWSGWLITTFVGWQAGGARSVNTMNYAVLLVACAWLLGHRPALAMTGMTLLAQAVFLTSEANEWLPPAPVLPTTYVGTYNVMILGLIATLTLLSRRSYKQRLAREQRYSEALAVREAEMHKLTQALEQSPESVLITDLKGRIEYANAIALERAGCAASALIGRDARQMVSPRTNAANLRSLSTALRETRTWRGELHLRRGDGRESVESITIAPVRQPDGQATHHVWLQQDITARREAEARVAHLERHDALTGLPNRRELETRLAERLKQATQARCHLALVVLNIDRFKTINEARGQGVGDALLQALALRLRSLLYRHELLAHVGADEFAVLLPDLEAEAGAASHQAYGLACQVHEALLQPLQLSQAEPVTVTASIGIALCPASEVDTPAEALRRAANALSEAKRHGGAQIAFFESAMGDAAQQRFRVERDLREALADHQLRLFLQPQVDAKGRWTGAEALVRWQHPTLGMVSPGLFIPIAEESELIVGVGRWVFTEAVRLMAAAAQAGLALPLSVNLSPRQFRQGDFVPWLCNLLAEQGVDPGLLTLEVTEGLVIGNVEQAIARMKELRALGLHFSIDDFGTGYSSLAYLKRLPISELKIDKAFIQDAPTHPDDAALVETILSVAAHMQLKVVAEGVETQEQADFLAHRDASVILQGYLFGKPAPAREWLQRWQEQQVLPPLPGRAAGTPQPLAGADIAATAMALGA